MTADRIQRTVQTITMAGVMTFFVTALITAINVGFPADYAKRWMVAWAIAWPAATAAASLAIPIARRTGTWAASRLGNDPARGAAVSDATQPDPGYEPSQ